MTSEPYKTFLSPLHRELIDRALYLAGTVKDRLGGEDRERAEEALVAVCDLLDGEGTREAVVALEKQMRAAATKWNRKQDKVVDWSDPYEAALLFSAVANLAASEFPKTQTQLFEQCLNLWRSQ